MSTTLRMPDLGTVEGTVTLVRWLKREGETVSLGEPLFEVETDKGVSEVESAAEGTLLQRLVAEGAAVASGDPIASIQGRAEAGQPKAPPAEAPAGASPTPRPPAVPTARIETSGAVSRRGTAPSLAALARKHGMDLSTVRGSGPAGAVTRQDILKARDAAAPADGTEAVLGLTPMQAIVAARVSQSHREKPVFHVTARVDMSRVIAVRTAQPGLRFDAFFVKACAAAVQELPAFRRWMSGTQVRSHESVDIAVAIGVDEDLFAPVVRGPAAGGLETISAEIDRLATRARTRSLAPHDSQGGCFLVSNLGMLAVESFDAVILPEHSAALAVGAAVPTVVPALQSMAPAQSAEPARDAAGFRVLPLAALTLSVDHRLINGTTAAKLLGRVKQLLEEGWE
jgi:pyruvate dehydrogenase E2 component (dihydrolipoamide acetyltransferase)